MAKIDAYFAIICHSTTADRLVHDGVGGWGDDDQCGLCGRLIASISSICFQAMADCVGMDAAVSAIWPHSKHSGMAMALNARRRFSIEDNDVLAISLPIYWTDGAMARGKCSPLRIFKDGASAEIYDCPLKEGPAMLCFVVSHGITEGISESVNPDYRLTYTHHIPNGDRFCRWIVHKKNVDSMLEDLGPEVDRLIIDYLQDEKKNLGDHCSGEILMWLCRASQDLGIEDVVSQSTRKPLMELGASLVGSFGERNRDGPGIARTISSIRALSGMLRQEIGSVVSSSSMIKGETSSCPFKTGTELTCEMLEHLFDGFCGAMDPPCAYEHSEESRSEGTSCHWRVTIPGPMERDGRDHDIDISEAISVLKIRLAKGEISEQEYERKARLLFKY